MNRNPTATASLGDARLVARYRGAQIFDAREHLIITFEGKPRKGVAGQLHNGNWSRSREGIWSKASDPQTIYAAQTILREAYGEAL
jgi:hypothetical protein